MPAVEGPRLVRYGTRPNWYVRDAGRRISTGQTSRAAAERFLADYVAGNQRPAGAALIPDILTRYLADRQARKLPGAERLSWAHKPLARHLASTLAEEFGEADALRYISAREADGVAPGTYRTELSSLRAALRWAATKAGGGLLEKAPAVMVPSRPPAKERWLTREEAAKLIEACRAPHVRLFVVLALNTGARAGAILALTWDRVDLERRRIDYRETGRAQTRKRRVPVPINDTLAAALVAEHKRLQPAAGAPVVTFGGTALASVKHAFADATTRAGLADVTPHTLRHTAATWAAQAGVPLFQIAGLLGHSDMRMISEVYGHHHPDHLQDVARALG